MSLESRDPVLSAPHAVSTKEHQSPASAVQTSLGRCRPPDVASRQYPCSPSTRAGLNERVLRLTARTWMPCWQTFASRSWCGRLSTGKPLRLVRNAAVGRSTAFTGSPSHRSTVEASVSVIGTTSRTPSLVLCPHSALTWCHHCQVSSTRAAPLSGAAGEAVWKPGGGWLLSAAVAPASA